MLSNSPPLCPTHYQDLAFDYDMVLTTFNRLSAEYGNGFDRAMGGTGVRPTGNRQVTPLSVGCIM